MTFTKYQKKKKLYFHSHTTHSHLQNEKKTETKTRTRTNSTPHNLNEIKMMAMGVLVGALLSKFASILTPNQLNAK